MRSAAAKWRVVIACTASLACSAGATAEPFTAEQLMASLAARPESVIEFTETRHSSMLKEPLVTTGELRFKPPSTLERRITTPFAERYLVEGDRLTIERPGSAAPRTLSLAGQPLLANLVGTIRALLRGDLQTLKRLYRVELRGEPDNWALTLLPSDPAMVEFVASVHVKGRAAAITEMEVVEPNGDRTVTHFGRAQDAPR